MMEIVDLFIGVRGCREEWRCWLRRKCGCSSVVQEPDQEDNGSRNDCDDDLVLPE